jgi:uncharacterized circularly permuted ATP-grasp superfamily protein/uncharacterized alpha-E superfamily protein
MTLAISPDLEYSPDPATYDEMALAGGKFRPIWSDLLETLRSFSPEELKLRWKQVQALLRENGVTFNVYGRDDGLDRPWNLDPFPLLLTTQEWAIVDRGLKQRVRLFEALLEDVYGEQRCLKENWIPAPLVWGNPDFLRACHGLPIPAECRLLLHSVDLVRNAQGQLIALRDRAETPGGCGYALENRLALTRMMPEFFQTRAVRKLSPFFQAVRGTLREIAERFGPSSKIVFLTPGSASQTYFEQAYLAQYLGFTLVQGDDLTVRDNRVYLKLLEGLQPVDVIVRRLRDSYCDPLELRSDSVIGIPGLVQAVRAGNVVVANSLGCAFAETTALHAYLPELCRHYLDETLLLESVPTYWCGEPDKLSYVLDNLEKLVIRGTFAQKTDSAIFFPTDDELDISQIRHQILADPEAFVAQEKMQLSTAPSLADGGLEPRRVLLRTFITRTGKEHVVMPGALALVASEPDSIIASLDSGSQSKDTWILEEESTPFHWPKASAKSRLQISRGGGDVSSRAADSLYWLGRYLERGEGLCRVLRCCFSHLVEEPIVPSDSALPTLLYFISPRRNARKLDRESYTTRLLELLTDPDSTDGLRVSLDGVRRLTGVLRDRISTESWTISNQLLGWSKEHPQTVPHALDVLHRMQTGFSACNGMISDNMTRNHGWRFLEIGRRLERAVHTVALLRRCLTLQNEVESDLVEALLEITDTVRTYRRRYPAGLEVAPAIDLFLADPSNPRSVAFQLERLEEHLGQLPTMPCTKPLAETDRILIRALASIRLADAHDLALVTKGERRMELTGLLRDIGKALPEFSDHLARRYFSHLTLRSAGPTYGREVLP